jgi:hypothetical protein
MSAITSDWAILESAPAERPSASSGRPRTREAEFRAALDSYMADYVRTHAARTGAGTTRVGLLASLAGLIGR